MIIITFDDKKDQLIRGSQGVFSMHKAPMSPDKEPADEKVMVQRRS